MFKPFLKSCLFLSIGLSTLAFANDTETDTSKKKATDSPLCLIKGTPIQSDYKVVRRMKLGKGTYGSFQDLYPEFKRIGAHYKADAVINFNESQRFGFWPWRVVRPVLTGTAVKWESSTPLDCNALGGKQI